MLNTLKMDILFNLKQKMFLVAVFLVFIVVAFADYINFASTYGISVGVGDLAARLYGGIPPYVYSPENRFEMPTAWIFALICPCLLSLYYAHTAVHGFGMQLLVRTPSRSAWLKEKIIWIACNSAALILFEIILMIVCSSVSHHGLPSLSFNNEALQLINMSIPENVSDILLLAQMMVVEFLFIFMLSSLSYLLASAIGFIGSLVALLAYIFITIFTDLPVMLCTRIMFIRSEPFLSQGDNLIVSIIIALIISIGALFLTKPVARFMKLA